MREKLDGQGVSNFFSEIDLWNFFFSLGYAKKLDGADAGEGGRRVYVADRSRVEIDLRNFFRAI